MSTGRSETSGRAGFVRSVTQIGRPSPTARVNVYGPARSGSGSAPGSAGRCAARVHRSRCTCSSGCSSRYAPTAGRRSCRSAGVARVLVGDDVEPAACSSGSRCCRWPGRGPIGTVRVARIERADDQLALRVQLHVLVLPVAALGEIVRDELVQQHRILRVLDVVRLEAEAARDDENVVTAHAVELALGDPGRPRDPRQILQIRRDHRPWWQIRRLCARRSRSVVPPAQRPSPQTVSSGPPFDDRRHATTRRHRIRNPERRGRSVDAPTFQSIASRCGDSAWPARACPAPGCRRRTRSA